MTTTERLGANDPALLKHISRQQDIAVHIRSLLEGVLALRNEGVAEAAQDAILETAFRLTGELSENLDSVNLLKVGAP